MKFNKKKVLLAALAISLVAILSLGSLAWFNDADTVVNQFKVASSDDDGTPDFSVDLWETDPDNPGVKDQDGIVYEDIFPGETMPKDPTVENTGLYDQWIRVKVTFQGGVVNNVPDLRSMLDVDTAIWYADDYATTSDTDIVTYVYYLRTKLPAGQTAVLFNNVTIPSGLDQNTLTDFNISVLAEALQADNTGTDPVVAFLTYWS